MRLMSSLNLDSWRAVGASAPLVGVDFYIERLGAPVNNAQILLFADGVQFDYCVSNASGEASYRTSSPPAGTITYCAYDAFQYGTTGSALIDAPEEIILSETPSLIEPSDWYAKPGIVATAGLAANLSLGSITLYMGDFIQSTSGSITRTWFSKTSNYVGADVGNGVGLAACLATMSGLTFTCDNLGSNQIFISVGNPAWTNPDTWHAETSAGIEDQQGFCP